MVNAAAWNACTCNGGMHILVYKRYLHVGEMTVACRWQWNNNIIHCVTLLSLEMGCAKKTGYIQAYNS